MREKGRVFQNFHALSPERRRVQGGTLRPRMRRRRRRAPTFTRRALRSSVGAVLRRGRFAGAGAEHEARQNPDRDLVEDDPGEQARGKTRRRRRACSWGECTQFASLAGGDRCNAGEGRRIECVSFSLAA